MEEEKKENVSEEPKVEPIVIQPPTEETPAEPVVIQPPTEEAAAEPVVIESLTEDTPAEPAVVESLTEETPAEPTVEPVVEQTVEQPVEEVQSEPVVEQAAEPTAEEVPAEQPTEEKVAEDDKKKKKNPLIFVLPLVVVVIAIVAILLMQKPNKENKDSGEGKEEIVTNSDIKSDYRMSGNSIEAFDLYFLKLENEAKNKVYSPLSIKYALEMLAEGSNGESKAQLDAVIGDYKANKYQNSANMSFGNAMFIRNNFKDQVKQDYIDTLSNKYGAEVITDPFENADNINKWVSDKTFGLIPNLLSEADKDFYLINALAIDMKWVNLLHCASGSMERVPCVNNFGYSVEYLHEKVEGEDNEYKRISYPYTSDYDFKSQTFNGKENIKSADVLASFNRYDAVNTIGEDRIRQEVGAAFEAWLQTDEAKMYEYNGTTEEYLDAYIKEINSNYNKAQYSTDFSLYVDDNVKTFAKDLQTYDGTTLQYIGIMPKNESLTDYVKNLKVEDLNNIIANLKDMKIENFDDGYVTLIEGNIPLFKYEYELNLMDDLKELGITDVFELGKADLSRMVEGSAFIAEAKHKATIEFSNEGIKAAAATAEGGAGNTGGGFNYLYEVPTKRIDIDFNNPYMYLIRDKATGEVWFIGTVYDPITK